MNESGQITLLEKDVKLWTLFVCVCVCVFLGVSITQPRPKNILHSKGYQIINSPKAPLLQIEQEV